MHTDPTDSPKPAKSMFVPAVVVTLIAYGALILIHSLSLLGNGRAWLLHFWASVPLDLVAYATPVALFLAVFAINEKRAILVPIGGVFAAAILSHYLNNPPDDYGAFEQLRLRNDLWNAIKYELPEALLIAGLGIVAARWWAPRKSDDPTRFAIPPLKPALIFFVVTFGIAFALSFAQSRGVNLHYAGRLLYTTTTYYAIIAMCLISAVALKGWTALLPLAFILQTFTIYMLQLGGCDAGGLGGGSCWDALWPYFRIQIVVFAVLWMASVLAGAFARDEKQAPAEPAVAVEV